MSTNEIVRKCQACGIKKPFNHDEWLVSRNAPSGHFCKLCVAAKRRAERQVAKSPIGKSGVRLDLMTKDQLLELAEVIQYTNGVLINAVLDDEAKFIRTKALLDKHGFIKTVLLTIK